MASTNLRAAVVTVLAAQLLACVRESDYFLADSTVEGELAYVPSQSSVGKDAGAQATLLSAGRFAPFPRCSERGAPCAQANVGYYLVNVRFDPPAAPGTFALADLAAVACENATGNGGERCSPVSGSLEVTVLTPPCDDDACGRFDGVLSIDAPAVVHGTATLHYSERIETVEHSGCNGQGG